MDVAARLVWVAVVMVGLLGCAEGREGRRCSGKMAMGTPANAEDVRAADGWRVVFREADEEEGLKVGLGPAEGSENAEWVLDWDLGVERKGREVWISSATKEEGKTEEETEKRAWAVCERGYVTAYGVTEEKGKGLRLGFEKMRSPRVERSGAVVGMEEGAVDMGKAGEVVGAGRGYAWLIEDGGVVGEKGKEQLEWGWLVRWEPVVGADGKVRVGKPRIVWMERAEEGKRKMREGVVWGVAVFDEGTRARGPDGLEQEFAVYVLRVVMKVEGQWIIFRAMFGLSSEGALFYRRAGGGEVGSYSLWSSYRTGLWRAGGAKLHGGGFVRVMR